MSLLGRDGFTRDLVILMLVGIVCASLFSLGLAMTTDKYFARAVTGVIGDYGQYDLLFQVRAEMSDAAKRQLLRIVADRFPGSRLQSGMTIAGKSTIFLRLAKPFRTREVFEGLYYYFGNLPGNAGFSIIAEPRIVLSSVPGGAQDLLTNDLARLSGVDFVFRDGENLNLVLRSARALESVRNEAKRIIGRYQLLEIRFPVNNPVSDLGSFGQQLEAAVRRVPGVSLAKDVTRGGMTGDNQYMAAALSELRRFMISYAARVTVKPVGGSRLAVGDRLVLQGRAPRLPVPGQGKTDQFVEVKLERVANGVGEGLIVQGDASYIENVSAFRLLPGEKVGAYVGTVSVVDEGSLLSKGLDEGVKLLQQVQSMAADPAWEQAGSLRSYQGILTRMGEVQKLLTSVRNGLDVATSAETRARLRAAAAQIDGISDDLRYLASTTARVKLFEDRISLVLDRFSAFQFLMRSKAAQDGPRQGADGLGTRLLAADQGLTAVGESLRRKARQLDDFINRFNPVVQVLLGWGERAHVLAEQLDYFSGALEPGSKARQALDSLLGATGSTLDRLRGFDALGLLQDISSGSAHLSSLGRLDLDTIIDQMRYVRNSLPRLLDEEIGRSVGMIDRYLGGEVVPGERVQLLLNAGADLAPVSKVVTRVSGRGGTNLLRTPVGIIEPDFRGEIFRVLGEVRTTITALVLLALFILEFLLDQTTIVAMLRRQTETVSRRMAGSRPRLARYATILLNPARVYAAGFGGTWLWACFTLTGARLPLLGGMGAAVLGGILGLLLGSLADRINPINGDEVMAGESLGLSFALIMREIVIPAGRPGLLQILNRRRLLMRGGRT